MVFAKLSRRNFWCLFFSENFSLSKWISRKFRVLYLIQFCEKGVQRNRDIFAHFCLYIFQASLRKCITVGLFPPTNLHEIERACVELKCDILSCTCELMIFIIMCDVFHYSWFYCVEVVFQPILLSFSIFL